MKRNLVIDDDIVENKTLYKKVNDIKKERENEKEKDLIMPKCLIKELNKLLF